MKLWRIDEEDNVPIELNSYEIVKETPKMFKLANGFKTFPWSKQVYKNEESTHLSPEAAIDTFIDKTTSAINRLEERIAYRKKQLQVVEALKDALTNS